MDTYILSEPPGSAGSARSRVPSRQDAGGDGGDAPASPLALRALHRAFRFWLQVCMYHTGLAIVTDEFLRHHPCHQVFQVLLPAVLSLPPGASRAMREVSYPQPGSSSHAVLKRFPQ